MRGRALLSVLLFLAALTEFVVAQEREALSEPARTVRFAAIGIYIDSAEPLAAWQFELIEANGAMTVVGVESGESAAFAGTPYYDLGAVRAGAAERIIVADFSLDREPSLPVGRFRAATVHVQLSGMAEPDYELTLIAAGNADGNPIEANIELTR